MEGGSHSHPRSWRRIGLTAAVVLVLLVMMSGAALGEGVVLQDKFDGDDGARPSKAKWALLEVDGSDRVQIENNTLELFGDAAVKSKHGFESEDFNVTVEVAVRDLNGTPISIHLESEVHGKKDPATYLSLTYDTTDGWKTISWFNKVEHTNNSSVANVEVDVWYIIELRVHGHEYNVTVLNRSDNELVWHTEGEVKAFHHENFIELGVAHSEVNYDNLKVHDNVWRWQENPDLKVATGLFIIFFVVLLGPFLVKQIEHQLEIFLFINGVVAVTVASVFLEGVEPGGSGHSMNPVWSLQLVEAGLKDPIMITTAVLVAGLVFHYGREKFKVGIERLLTRIDLKIFIFIIIVVLGLIASIITAIISALLLVEVITILRLDRKTETDLTILTCFSIGLGAALTPVGEPLSTIVIVTKLREEFWFLLKQIGHFIIPTIIGLGIFGVYYISRSHVDRDTLEEEPEEEHIKEVPIRAFKVYIFVMALVFLGTGFAPLIEWYIIKLGPEVLYWVNMSSAILDNATLASAEIVPTMTKLQLNAALMALLISGGMLIPGNIPNIISAGKLKIGSKAWARFGVPFGLVLMGIFFVILFLLKL